MSTAAHRKERAMPSETLTTDELIELWRAALHMHEHAIRIARLSGEKRDREAEEAWYQLAGKCERMAAAGLRAAHQERDADARRLDWMLRNVSGAELRRLGVVWAAYDEEAGRAALDAAMAPDTQTVTP